jgi:heterodisulfide reductase subunit A
LNTEVIETGGILGNFTSTLATGGETLTTVAIEHGVTIITTGGKEYKPSDYLYGKHDNVLTHKEMDEAMTAGDPRIPGPQRRIHTMCGITHPGAALLQPALLHPHRQECPELKKRNPEMDVYVLYRDIRTYGFREELYKTAREKGIIFMRYNLEDNMPRCPRKPTAG